jgi:hypothetical protein
MRNSPEKIIEDAIATQWTDEGQLIVGRPR